MTIPTEAIEAAAKDLDQMRTNPATLIDYLSSEKVARLALEAAAPLMRSASAAAMATIIREHWPAEVPHPMYPTYVQCMKHGCEWDGRFLGDISEHVAELIAAGTK